MDIVKEISCDTRFDNDIILLTGAGASGYIGLPTLNEISNRITLIENENTRLIDQTRRVVESSKYSSAVFEELIGGLKYYAKTAEMMRTDHLFHSELGSVANEVFTGVFERKWKGALTDCYRTLLKEYGPQKIKVDTEPFKNMVNLYKELATLNKGKLYIYTTNYDCSYQVIPSKHNDVAMLSHINNDSGLFADRWFVSNKDTVLKSSQEILVNRLHGCVAWFSDANNPFDVEEVYGAGGDLEVNDEDKINRMSIKLVTTQPIGVNPAFVLAFNEFMTHLNVAKKLLVWGFSFRDMEVVRTINNSIAVRKEPLPIYYINPFMKETTVIQNIRTALRNVPVTLSPNFKPKRIDWSPADGHDKLIVSVINALK